MAQLNKQDPNVTSFGLENGKINILHVAAGGGLSFGCFAMDICSAVPAITTCYFWPDTSGKLRYGTTAPTTATQDSAGTAIGS
jgi:hypothetical protein